MPDGHITHMKVIKKLLPFIKAKNDDYKARKVPATIDHLLEDLEKLV